MRGWRGSPSLTLGWRPCLLPLLLLLLPVVPLVAAMVTGDEAMVTVVWRRQHQAEKRGPA